MRSLTLKVILAFLFVSLLGVALVALYVGLRTQNEFDRFMLDQSQDQLVTALVQYYQSTGAWDGAEAVFRYYYSGDMRQNPRMAPVMLVDASGKVAISRMAGMADRQVPQAQLEQGVPLRVDGRVVGWVVFGSAVDRRNQGKIEQAFLARVNRAILFSILGAAAMALLLSILLARTLTRPIRELTAATQAVAKGELGRQVAVHSDDELGELAASFNRMSADLAQASELRRQMTADIAHELRTPLSLILGYTEALSDGKLQGTPETFDIMHDEAKRLGRLVDDLRVLSLADAGELLLMRQPIAPQALLEQVALAYAAQAEAHKVSLQVKATPNLPTINADWDRMVQVLGNLVSNALRHTPGGGQITLSAEQTGGQTLLKVQDTGSGIAPEDLPHIFDRFYRGDKSRSRQEGESGLGLAIAKAIVETHSGRLTAESAVGKGATFTIAMN